VDGEVEVRGQVAARGRRVQQDGSRIVGAVVVDLDAAIERVTGKQGLATDMAVPSSLSLNSTSMSTAGCSSTTGWSTRWTAGSTGGTSGAAGTAGTTGREGRKT
jgi:hypothetical protein